MSPLRKKTLRKMPPKTRELARIIQEAYDAEEGSYRVKVEGTG